MAELVFGDVDWNSADVGGGKADFMKLTQGGNTVRIMASPVQFYVNWLDTSDGRRKVNTPIEDPDLVQRLDDADFRRQTRWILKVLDRSDDKFRLLEVGPQIFKAVRGLVRNKKWGKVTNYDININKGPKGTQPLYSVVPDPKEALPESLKESWVEFRDNINIERLISPSDPAYVYDLLGWTPAGDSSEEDDDVSFTFNE